MRWFYAPECLRAADEGDMVHFDPYVIGNETAQEVLAEEDFAGEVIQTLWDGSTQFIIHKIWVTFKSCTCTLFICEWAQHTHLQWHRAMNNIF